jgi:hypothetical protein
MLDRLPAVGLADFAPALGYLAGVCGPPSQAPQDWSAAPPETLRAALAIFCSTAGGDVQDTQPAGDAGAEEGE